MASPLTYVTEGTRVALKSWKNRLIHKKYPGKADFICRQIVRECWNGHFFQTSTDNFPQFWTRDFGWCTQALMVLKFEKEVHQTLRYALNRFKEAGAITTTITPQGKTYDFPTLAVDSLPWLIHSLKLSKFPVYTYRNFLNQEIEKFFTTFVNPHTGLVRPELHVSSIKDFAIRKSSCYDNSMVGLLAKDLAGMKLINPLAEFNYSDLLKRHFWSGEFFFDDLRKKNYVAGDANLFPFILGLIKDKEMMESAIRKIQENELDLPFPLKYTKTADGVKFIWQEKLAMKDYESNAVWTHMGPFFIKLVKHFDKEKAKEYKQAYTEMIEKYQGYPEVLNSSGKPFQTWFYYCDRSMLWAVNYLDI